MTELTNLVGNVGFPIVACFFMYKQQVKLQETITDLTSTLKGIDTRLNQLERKSEEGKEWNIY